MKAQKHKKKCWKIFFAFLIAKTQLETQLVKALSSLDSSRSYRRLLENPKAEACRELFLAESDFKTSSTVNFPKNIQILDSWKPTKHMKPRLEFFFISPSTYELNII